MTERTDYFTSHNTATKQVNVIVSDEFGMVKLEDDNTGGALVIDIVAARRIADFIKGDAK